MPSAMKMKNSGNCGIDSALGDLPPGPATVVDMLDIAQTYVEENITQAKNSHAHQTQQRKI